MRYYDILVITFVQNRLTKTFRWGSFLTYLKTYFLAITFISVLHLKEKNLTYDKKQHQNGMQLIGQK